MNKKILFSLIGLVLILAVVAGVYKLYINKANISGKKLVDKERNLTVEQQKIYTDRIKEAEEYLKNYKNQDQTFVQAKTDVYVFLGQEYFGLGQLEKSKNMYDTALRENATNEQAMVGLSVVYQDAGDKGAALSALEQAINNKTKNADIWLRYIQMRKEEGTAAVNLASIYNNALDATKRSADLLTSFAQFQEQSGKPQEALLLWQEALKQYPDNEAFKNEIKRLKSK